MRRHKNLYPKIVSFQNLLKAAKLAQRGKRFKDSTARFNFDLEKELWKLHYELTTKRYRPGNYRHFTIYEPTEIEMPLLRPLYGRLCNFSSRQGVSLVC